MRETMDDLGHTSPRRRGTPRLPVHALERPDRDPRRHRPEGTPDRQVPQRGGQTQDNPAGKRLTGPRHAPRYRETGTPSYRNTEKPEY